MSVLLILREITVDQYDRLVSGDIDMSSWDLEEHILDSAGRELHPLLVNGNPADPPRAVKAITGEVVVPAPHLPYEPPFGEVRQEIRLPDGSSEYAGVSGLGAVSAALVPELAADLAAVTDEEFAERAARILVPPVFAEQLTDEEVSMLLSDWRDLQNIYETAAEHGTAVALWLS